MPARPSSSPWLTLALFSTPVIWGVSFPAGKVALETLDLWDFMAWSRGLGLALMIVVVLAVPTARRVLDRRLILPGAVLGALVTVAFAVQTLGLRETTATNAGFITGLYVVLVPLLAALVLHERMTAGSAAAALLALVGLALLSLRGVEVNRGDLYVLGGAFLFAVHLLALGRLAPRYNPLALGFAQMAGTAVLHTLLALPGGLDPGAAADVWGPLIVTGVLSSGVAYLLQVVAQQAISPARAAVILAGESLFAAISGAIWLDERLTWRQWVGAGLMVAAMVLSEVRAARGPVLDPASGA